jgi:hypothetical protein
MQAFEAQQLADVSFSIMQRSVLRVLGAAYPRDVPIRTVAEDIYGGRKGPSDEIATLRSIISQLNRKLVDLGWKVACKHGSGAVRLVRLPAQ